MTDPLPYDLHHDLITVAQAAELAGVSEDVIRQWKRRGRLTPAGVDESRRPLFTGIAVLRAEAATRKAARRPRALADDSNPVGPPTYRPN